MQELFGVMLSELLVVIVLLGSLIVGYVRNLIRYGNAILIGNPIAWGHMLPIFPVLYMISSYGVAFNQLSNGATV